ncbi:MAG TPA: CopG family transcriptional regulator [Acidimicrobiales bacterium]|nr:CopG family transcriptional regulator [Acidimicrobiales bacterium]
MPKEKVTLTLDAESLRRLRAAVGSRSLSAAVDSAVAAYLVRLEHLAAVDDWLAEMERDHGPVPTETLEWAAQLVERWQADRRGPAKKRRAV